MKRILILSIGLLFAGELEVDGDLKVTGNIQNDSLAVVIANLQAQITALQSQAAQAECHNTGIIPEGYCDCFGNVLDECGWCNGDGSSCAICEGLTEVELWGEWYDIESTTGLYIEAAHEVTGSIPPEIGCLTNLTEMQINNQSQLTGSIPPEIGNLINLEHLYIMGNAQLTGSIPPELGNLTNLMNLGLNNNQLTGSIPPELGNLTNLMYLSLDNNQLTGYVPPEVCNLLISNPYISLVISNNNLSNTCE